MLEQYDNIINDNSTMFGVPVAWIKAVIMQESSGNPNAHSADGGYGLMQLQEPTARGLGYTGDINGLFDVTTNIMLGTQLLGQLRSRYGDDFQAVYSAYNSGSGTAYLSSSVVADHVQKAMVWLEKVVSNEPFVASSGVAVILVFILMWYWKRKGK